MKSNKNLRRFVLGLALAATMSFLLSATPIPSADRGKDNLHTMIQVAEKGSDGQETHG